MVDKIFVTAQSLLSDSFRLGLKIMDDGFHPDYIIGIWRGGTPVGIAVQELLKYHGYPSDHIAIRTSSYTGIEEQSDEIRVHGLHYVIENVNAENSLLIVDDVFDSGRSNLHRPPPWHIDAGAETVHPIRSRRPRGPK